MKCGEEVWNTQVYVRIWVQNGNVKCGESLECVHVCEKLGSELYVRNCTLSRDWWKEIMCYMMVVSSGATYIQT